MSYEQGSNSQWLWRYGFLKCNLTCKLFVYLFIGKTTVQFSLHYSLGKIIVQFSFVNVQNGHHQLGFTSWLI